MVAEEQSSGSGSGSGSGGDVENVVLSEKELLKKEEDEVVGPVKTLSPVTSNLRNSPKAKTMLFLDMTPWSGNYIQFLWTSLEMKR